MKCYSENLDEVITNIEEIVYYKSWTCLSFENEK